jgi:hypothetical protein
MFKELILKLKLIFIPCEANKYRPKFLDGQFLTYYVISLLILKLFLVPFIIYFPKSIFFAEITKTALIDSTNEERVSSGISSLKENAKLDEAAYLKASDMIEKDYFSHQSPEGISPWYWFNKVGYNYKFAGENLAIGFLDSKEVHQAWMASPSHQKNLLNPNYQETGIAVLKGDFQGSEAVVAVQLFGTPQTSVVTPQVLTPEKVEEKGGEVLSVTEPEGSASLPEEGKDIALNLFQFTALSYSNVLQKIIYGSLIFIILSLLIVIIFDVFIYQKFEIQYKDIVFNTIGFIILLIIFLSLDKENIIQLIPHNFRIY